MIRRVGQPTMCQFAKDGVWERASHFQVIVRRR